MHIFPLQKAFGRDPEESDVDEVILPTSDTESEAEESSTEVTPEQENADDANATQMTELIDAHSSILDPATVPTELTPPVPDSDLAQRDHGALEGHLEEHALQKASEHTEVITIQITMHSFLENLIYSPFAIFICFFYFIYIAYH
jgi:hypothetical protein